MQNAEEYIQQSIEVKALLSTLARELTAVQVPEFSSEPMTVKDAAELTGLSENEIRAGILYEWLPIGIALKDGKPVTGKQEGRATFVIYPRKVWELTGHVWRGKEAQP